MRIKDFLKEQVTIEFFLLFQIVSMLFTMTATKISQKILAKQTVLHPICKIIQVGEEKQSLSTQYLLELLGLSYDKPFYMERVDKEELLARVKKSPLIESAMLETVYPDAIYLEYKTRRPIALLEDFKNIAIDKGKYIFPLKPFLSSKKLPKIYLGIKDPLETSMQEQKQAYKWNYPIQNPKLDLAYSLLDFIAQSENLRSVLKVQRVDVSEAFEKSFGKRSIILIDEIVLNSQGNRVQKAILRLHHKQFTQGLINYCEWKNHYLKERFDKIGRENEARSLVIDLRIPQMAFVEEIRI